MISILIALGVSVSSQPPIDAGKPLRIKLEKRATAIAFCPGGPLAVAQAGGRVSFVTDGKEGRRLETGQDYIKEVAFSKDGVWMATASMVLGNGRMADGPGVVKLWRLSRDGAIGPEPVQTLGDATGTVAFSADGTELAVAVFGADRQVVVVKLGQKAKSQKIQTPFDGPIDSLAWRPDGKALAVVTSSGEIWEVGAGFARKLLEAEITVRGLAWSLDGKTLAFPNGKTVGERLLAPPIETPTGTVVQIQKETRFWITLWNVQKGKGRKLEADTFQGEWHYPVFFPNGQRVAAAGVEKRAQGDVARVGIWDTRSGKLVEALDAEALGPPGMLAISPDGKQLAVIAGRDWSVRVWTIRGTSK
jgi:WD40 repeat protein